MDEQNKNINAWLDFLHPQDDANSIASSQPEEKPTQEPDHPLTFLEKIEQQKRELSPPGLLLSEDKANSFEYYSGNHSLIKPLANPTENPTTTLEMDNLMGHLSPIH